jgi:chaperone required for assembly of F1-ATPase
LPKRFYKAVTVAPTSPQEGGDQVAFGLRLDGKPVRTPARNELRLPTRALAEAVAAEWEAQGERVDPATMPLTRLANSVIDGVVVRAGEVRAGIVKYAGSDLLCYRAEGPAELVRRQAQAWDPVLDWARRVHGAGFAVAQGVMPAEQPAAARAAVAQVLEPYGPFALAALHVMTTLMGSALLALAHAQGRLSAGEAWAAAHVDEDWQISQWGEDAEATAARERRWAEMQAASRLLQLLGASLSPLAGRGPG